MSAHDDVHKSQKRYSTLQKSAIEYSNEKLAFFWEWHYTRMGVTLHNSLRHLNQNFVSTFCHMIQNCERKSAVFCKAVKSILYLFFIALRFFHITSHHQQI